MKARAFARIEFAAPTQRATRLVADDDAAYFNHMEKPRKRSLWDILRRMMSARMDLPASDTRGAINELHPQAWTEVEQYRQMSEREESDGQR